MAKASEPGAVAPPAISDYSKRAVNKAVVESGIKHPATVYPIALGAGSGVVGALFGMPVFYLGALAGLLLGPAWAVSQVFLFKDKNGSKYLEKLSKQQKEYEKYLVDLLEKGLAESAGDSASKEYAVQGRQQVDRVQKKFANVHDMLKLKLDPREMTFSRFLGAAEQATLSVLDNLKTVMGLVKSASSIDTGYIESRLQAMHEDGNITPDEATQKEAMEKRLELKKKQIQQVSMLLARNEQAMTEMETISAAIAAWKTDTGFADVDFESAITRLQELAKDAHEYN